MRSLNLKVALNGTERLSGPLQRLTRRSGNAADSLRATREQLRNLQRTEQTVNTFGKTRENLNRTNQSLEQARQRVRELTAAQRRGEGGSKRFAQQMRRANLEVRDLSQRSREQRLRLNEQRQALQQAGISTRQLSHSKRELTASIDSANQRLRQQQEQLRRVGDAQRRNRELSRQHGREMMRLGMAGGVGYGGVALARRAGYGAARLLAPGMDFDSTMGQVQALTRLDSNAPALKALRNHARELGGSTQFSATEVAGGQAFLAMAGFTPKSIRAAMPGLLDVALASGTDLARTADISSNILGGFNLEASKMPWVADTLTKTFTTSNTTLEMLGETMKYVGPVAQNAGVGLEKVAAMTGLLGNVGIQGSESGTALRAMLLRLSAPTGSAAKTLRALGIRITDENGKLRDMTDLLEEMHWALDSLGETDQLAILKDVFGERPAASVLELLNAAGDGRLRRYESTVSNNQGEATRTARTQADNLRGDLAELRSAWDDVRIQLMDENRGMLRSLVSNITGRIRSLGEWAKANPQTVQLLSKIALGTIAVTTALGGLTVTLVGILGPMLILRFILARLGLSLLPILGAGLRLVGKGALGAGKAFLSLKGLASTLVAPFRIVGRTVLFLGRALLLSPIGWAVTLLAGGALMVVRYWDRVRAFFGGFWEGLMEGLAPLRNALSGFANLFAPLKPAWGWIQRLINPLKATSEQLENAHNAGRSFGLAVGFVVDSIARLIGAAGRLVAFLGGQLWDGLTRLGEGMTGWWRDVTGAWEGGWGTIGSLTWDALKSLGEGILEHNPFAYLYTLMADLLNWLGLDVPRRFSQAGADLLKGLINGIKSMFPKVRETITSIGDSTIGWLKDKLGIRSPSRVFAGLGEDTLAGYQQGLRRRTPPMLRQVDGLSKQLKAAGAGLALGSATALPAAADYRLDTRPPITSGAPQITIGGDRVEFHIHAAPGMDEYAIARQVERLLEKREREKAARARALYHDR